MTPISTSTTTRLSLRLPTMMQPLNIPEPPAAPSPNTPAPVVAHRLDFSALGFPQYQNSFALVIDNLFTQADCDKLLLAAESEKQWEVAQVNGRSGVAFTDTSYREWCDVCREVFPSNEPRLSSLLPGNSSRIMIDSFELADWILRKVQPYLQDIQEVPGARHRTFTRNQAEPRNSKLPPGATIPSVRLSRLNERLRFLKYGPGQFFQQHRDGCYYTPDKAEVSYYTLQLYLNGDAENLTGGATRFHHPSRRRQAGERDYIDVEPRTGRALIFEQASLLHSGEEVTEGMKLTIRTDFLYKRIPEETEI